MLFFEPSRSGRTFRRSSLPLRMSISSRQNWHFHEIRICALRSKSRSPCQRQNWTSSKWWGEKHNWSNIWKINKSFCIVKTNVFERIDFSCTLEAPKMATLTYFGTRGWISSIKAPNGARAKLLRDRWSRRHNWKFALENDNTLAKVADDFYFTIFWSSAQPTKPGRWAKM